MGKIKRFMDSSLDSLFFLSCCLLIISAIWIIYLGAKEVITVKYSSDGSYQCVCTKVGSSEE